MSKFGNWFKTKFLSRQFITFVIIGVINTIINFLVMKLVLFIFDSAIDYDISTKDGGVMYYVSIATSTLLAFVVASLFSYFANAHFTYKQDKKDSRTFGEATLAFVLRFVLTYLFTILINIIINAIFHMENDPNGWVRTLSNLIASVIMIPPFFLALGFIFKRTKKRVESKEEDKENSQENTID